MTSLLKLEYPSRKGSVFSINALEIREFVTIDIFDLKGSLVNNLHSGVLNSGIQRINKNLEKLNTGIYILNGLNTGINTGLNPSKP